MFIHQIIWTPGRLQALSQWPSNTKVNLQEPATKQKQSGKTALRKSRILWGEVTVIASQLLAQKLPENNSRIHTCLDTEGKYQRSHPERTAWGFLRMKRAIWGLHAGKGLELKRSREKSRR